MNVFAFLEARLVYSSLKNISELLGDSEEDFLLYVDWDIATSKPIWMVEMFIDLPPRTTL